jgi:hypothetical protein
MDGPAPPESAIEGELEPVSVEYLRHLSLLADLAARGGLRRGWSDMIPEFDRRV